MTDIRQELKDAVYSNMAREISKLSKDKNTHVGSIIVASDGTPVSWGYNGTVSGFNDSIVPHSRDIETLQYMILDEDTSSITTCTFESNKYPFMSHSESNAIFFGDKSKLIGSTIYVTGFPCEICALQIARAQIARVVVTDINTDSGSTINNDNHKSMFIFSQYNMRLTINGKHYKLLYKV
jgi:dCMP deaminase